MTGQIILAGFVASIVWFIVGGVLYMNPLAKKQFKKALKSPAVQKIGKHKEKKWMGLMYLLGCLLPSLIFAWVYYVVKSALPGTMGLAVLYFGLMLFGIKIVPRLVDMSLITTYPKNLLVMDLVNGTIASFVVALVLVLML